jgi:phosphomannomutase/phosphoglucomutase
VISTPPPAEIFKAYDIRGIVGKTLTTDYTRQIGLAIGSEARSCGQTSIVIGRDGRLSGPDLAAALSEGLQAAGMDVTDIGVAPTPVVYFAAFELGIPSCVAITGSHNPPDYNGFKTVIDGTTLSAERIQALRQRILDNDFSEGAGKYRNVDVIDAYVSKIAGDIKPVRQMKIVIDCGNGVAGAVAPQLYRTLGCDVVELFSEVDGNFPNHHPDPSQPQNLQDLIRAVSEHDAEVGLAFDGDGDRLGVVTPDGGIVWPDRQMILYARDVLARQPGAEIIYDVKCSRTLPVEILRAGGKPTMWRTGHSFIKSRLKESGAALAGEMSGHIFFKERWYGFDDGMYSGARLLELLSGMEQTPQEVFDTLPDTVNTPELHIHMAEGEHFKLMDELTGNARFDDADISTIDGLRADFADGFGLIRPSNTTPVLVMRFEADTQAGLERIQGRFRDLINTTRAGLKIPF